MKSRRESSLFMVGNLDDSDRRGKTRHLNLTWNASSFQRWPMGKYFIVLFVAALLFILFGVQPSEWLARSGNLPLRAGLSRFDRVTVNINETNLSPALIMYSELTGRNQLPGTSPLSQQLDQIFGGWLSRWHLIKLPPRVPTGIEYHRDGLFSIGEVKDHLEAVFAANHLVLVAEGKKYFRAIQSTKSAEVFPSPVAKGPG